MAMADAVQAIKTRLALWTETEVIYEGGPAFAEPSPPRPFVKVDIEGGKSANIACGGGGVIRQQGTLRLNVFVPAGEGSDIGWELGDRLGRLFGNARLGVAQFWAPAADRPVIALGPDMAGLWSHGDPRCRASVRRLLWWLANASDEEIIAFDDALAARRMAEGEVPANA